MEDKKFKLSPDFIGDNPKTMKEGTICPIEEKEFNLNEERAELLNEFLRKISVGFDEWKEFKEAIKQQDKEFIRRLKEEMNFLCEDDWYVFENELNKLAGDDLIF